MAKSFCTKCGTELASDDLFCGSCGHPVEVAEDAAVVLGDASVLEEGPKASPHAGPPSTDKTVEQPPISAAAPDVVAAIPEATEATPTAGWWSHPRNRVGTGVGAAVVAVAVVLALVLGSGGGGSSVSATKRVGTTTTTLNAAFIQGQAAYKDYVTRLENILQQSTAGRSQVASLVSEVQNDCVVDPSNAASQIGAVVANRTSVLNQLAAMSQAPNAGAANLYSLLQQSLQSSINADTQYAAWMNDLYNDYYSIYDNCEYGGFIPTSDPSFQMAQADDSNSTALKNQFVAAFNPVATEFGLATWDSSSF